MVEGKPLNFFLSSTHVLDGHCLDSHSPIRGAIASRRGVSPGNSGTRVVRGTRLRDYFGLNINGLDREEPSPVLGYQSGYTRMCGLLGAVLKMLGNCWCSWVRAVALGLEGVQQGLVVHGKSRFSMGPRGCSFSYGVGQLGVGVIDDRVCTPVGIRS